MKSRTCADVCSQCSYISKEESSSPTVSIEAIFVTLVVDVYEERYVATVDIARLYLNADMDRFTTLKLESGIVDLMVQVNHEKYAEYIRYENSKKVLYIRLYKTLYGCIRSRLL